MAVLPIRREGDPVLRQKAKPVKKVGAGIRQLLDDMAETMYAAPGVGLAAPQVGIAKRVLVVDVGEGLVELINPEITSASGWEEGPEGCLSIPGYVGEVMRYTHLQVSGLNRQGRRIWVDAEGFFARALQHEIDHLDGILYTDKATNVRPVEPPPAEPDAADAEDAVAGGQEAGAATAAQGEESR